MARKTSVTLVILMLIPLFTVMAQKGTAVSFSLGTMGSGISAFKQINDKVNLRVWGNYFIMREYGVSESTEPILYDVELKMRSISAIVGYYPFSNFLGITGGLAYNNNIIDGMGTAVKNYLVDGTLYSPEDIGELKIQLGASMKWTPYLGITLGNPVGLNKKFGVFVDIGAFYQGSPDVSLSAEEDAMIYPTISQEESIEEDLQALKWFPVINLGFSYKF